MKLKSLFKPKKKRRYQEIKDDLYNATIEEAKLRSDAIIKEAQKRDAEYRREVQAREKELLNQMSNYSSSMSPNNNDPFESQSGLYHMTTTQNTQNGSLGIGQAGSGGLSGVATINYKEGTGLQAEELPLGTYTEAQAIDRARFPSPVDYNGHQFHSPLDKLSLCLYAVPSDKLKYEQQEKHILSLVDKVFPTSTNTDLHNGNTVWFTSGASF